ncbi:MAG: DUF1080 domain-containing protein [Alistipes sp.]|jgi:hypothetical protein|nr:DUF1080 domain-containing protein [Alistipes sp.]
MKKLLMNIAAVALAVAVVAPAAAQRPNTLTSAEQRAGWKLLFDGQSFGQWRKYAADAMPEQWSIDREHSAMKLATNTARPGSMQGADIMFAGQQFSNFEVSIDWMIEKGGNSGIMYYVVEEQGKPMYNAAPEVQVLDNWYAGDNKLANHLAGSLYDIKSALPQNAKPAMEWNTIVIRVDNGNVTHTQNGVVVCEYTLWTPEWAELVSRSKFKDWPGFNAGPAKTGYIGLQDHGYAVWFRNIKVREL